MKTRKIREKGFITVGTRCKGAPCSTKATGREPKSCLGQIFNFKIGSIVISVNTWHGQASPHLDLKTRPRLSPISFCTPWLYLDCHWVVVISYKRVNILSKINILKIMMK